MDTGFLCVVTVTDIMEMVRSGMAATCVVQPIDLIKTRMQLASSGTAKGVAAAAMGKP